MNVSNIYYTMGIVALVLVCAGIFIANFKISDSTISSYIHNAETIGNELNSTAMTMQGKTEQSPLQQLPVFGQIYTAGKILFGIAATVKDSAVLFVSFISDTIQLFAVNSTVANLIRLLLVGLVVFAFVRAIRG